MTLASTDLNSKDKTAPSILAVFYIIISKTVSKVLNVAKEEKPKVCGIVMPISECAGLGDTHWHDVKSIIEATATAAGFDARLVSETFESNLIHTEILQNIYGDDIVICDVSGQNPNVFFELGVRMATQKPTVIIKDDQTNYPFDTGPNRYIQYPRDLRHPLMEKFKAQLKNALEQTIDQPSEKSFIGQIGKFKVPDVESTELPAQEFILDKLQSIERELKRNAMPRSSMRRPKNIRFTYLNSDNVKICIQGYDIAQVENGIKDFRSFSDYDKLNVNLERRSPTHTHVEITGRQVERNSFERDFENHIDEAIPF
ncbi:MULTISPECIES: hypothetical protein [Pacificibacter]|uniref:hypothetical protein n=1 Tax=Pacificibacter TaxID=1042323 RepID=UPI001C0914F9|nr:MULTISPECIES: hypothetical protein [Pacificibacter]MBU2936526.1 hypothetical protein [Pacificibacter marinus]MDO6614672.1 hypothetical protein [Pacificibacter sp. 1_MG-2023]